MLQKYSLMTFEINISYFERESKAATHHFLGLSNLATNIFSQQTFLRYCSFFSINNPSTYYFYRIIRHNLFYRDENKKNVYRGIILKLALDFVCYYLGKYFFLLVWAVRMSCQNFILMYRTKDKNLVCRSKVMKHGFKKVLTFI
jgi:hypothetical protein